MHGQHGRHWRQAVLSHHLLLGSRRCELRRKFQNEEPQAMAECLKLCIGCLLMQIDNLNLFASSAKDSKVNATKVTKGTTFL